MALSEQLPLTAGRGCWSGPAFGLLMSLWGGRGRRAEGGGEKPICWAMPAPPPPLLLSCGPAFNSGLQQPLVGCPP